MYSFFVRLFCANAHRVSLQVTLRQQNPPRSHGIYAPHFPKRVDREQWWVVIGTPENELLVRTREGRRVVINFVFLAGTDDDKKYPREHRH